MTKPKLCIYHANCADGFGAAWAMREAHPDTEFYPGVHQKPPPDVAGRDVYLVDFSYKRDVIERMLEDAERIIVLDHHKSAIEDLSSLVMIFDGYQLGCRPGFSAVLDETRSGAMITWEYFHGRTDPPDLIRHIQDRDLWQFELPRTREVMAAVFSYPYDFDVWDQLIRADVFDLRQDGQAILRAHDKNVQEAIDETRFLAMIDGYTVPCANVLHTMASDAGRILSKGSSLFAATYYDTREGRKFSLRSDNDRGADVSVIAARYGGGGHKHAAGFLVPHACVIEGKYVMQVLAPYGAVTDPG